MSASPVNFLSAWAAMILVAGSLMVWDLVRWAAAKIKRGRQSDGG